MIEKVDFLGKKVSRLIIGDNPINGYSYIEDEIPGEEMKNFYTAEKIKEELFKMEEMGYNTMCPLADPYMIRILTEYKREGGKMQFIFQPYMSQDQDVSISLMEKVEPMGIYHQGTTTDNLYEQGRTEEILAMMEKYRKLGIPVGLGTHKPEVIETAEREGWGADFYMACLQHAREQADHTGMKPYLKDGTKMQGAVRFYEGDRRIMLDVLKKVKKPIIAYKIFAGGQMFAGKSEEEIRAGITGVYEEVFSCLKPGDIAAIGVFQRDKDQAREDAELFSLWSEGRQ